MKKITIVDVAKHAKVSVGTASKVINNEKGVSDELTKMVLESVKELNYLPSLIARDLKKQESNFISLHIIVPEKELYHPSSWAFYFQIIQGFSDTIKINNKRLHLEFNTIDEVSNFSEIERYLYSYDVQGAAFIIQQKSDYSGLIQLRKKGLYPLVTINAKIDDSISSATTTNYESVYNAIHWLQRLNHKRIAMISGPKNYYNSEERVRGYTDAMYKCPYFCVEEGDWSIESGYKAFKNIMVKEELATAISCANDHMAIGAIRAAKELHIRVPETISILGFDNNDMICEISSPELTSIKQNFFEIGKVGAELLVNEMKYEKKQTHQCLKTELVVRNSIISLPVASN